MDQLSDASRIQEPPVVIQDHPIHFLVNVVTRVCHQLKSLLQRIQTGSRRLILAMTNRRLILGGITIQILTILLP